MSEETPIYVQWGDLFLPAGQAFDMGVVGCLFLLFFGVPLFYVWAIWALLKVLGGILAAIERREWGQAKRQFGLWASVLGMAIAAYPFLWFWWEVLIKNMF